MSRSDVHKTSDDPFLKLSWDLLQDIVDSRILERGSQYQRRGRVTEIGRTSNGKVVAWVIGSQRYATMAWYEDEILRGNCTCPYGTVCKHFIALILEYLERLTAHTPVPTVGSRDYRLLLLEGPDGGADPDSEDDEDDYDKQGENGEDAPTGAPGSSALSGSLGHQLEELPRERLIELLKKAADLSTEVRDLLESQFKPPAAQMSRMIGAVRHDSQFRAPAASVSRMVAAARREVAGLRTVSGRSARGWGRRYEGVPDLAPLRNRTQAMLQAGFNSELLELGKEILSISDELVESYDEEGEFAAELGDCLTVVYEGLAQSDLSPDDQLKRLLTLGAYDEYDITDAGESAFWEAERAPEKWDGLASALLKLLGDPDRVDTPGALPDDLSDRTVLALEKAGREREVIPLREKEAERTGRDESLVERHISTEMIGALLEIAIRERKPDEVLRWYDHPRRARAHFHELPDYQVAAVLGERYPDRAIDIWKKLVEDALTETGDRAYRAAGSALRPLRDLLIGQNRESEWREYLSSLRAQHRRKRNLMPILDRVESGRRPIVET